jgi:hypothetical protein
MIQFKKDVTLAQMTESIDTISFINKSKDTKNDQVDQEANKKIQ